MKNPYKKVFISGASTGIGRDLALEFAQPDSIIGICARRTELLENLRKEIEARGALCLHYTVDVTNSEQCSNAAGNFVGKAEGVDLVVANAGVAAGTKKMPVPTSTQVKVINVNVNGTINTLNPFMDTMIQQGYGHLAVVSSVAAFRGLRGGSYSASKAAVKTLMDSWRLGLHKHNINVTTICPGFVETEMTQKSKKVKLPFMITSPKAASLIRKGLLKQKKTYVLPFIWKLVIPFFKIAPDFLLRAK